MKRWTEAKRPNPGLRPAPKRPGTAVGQFASLAEASRATGWSRSTIRERFLGAETIPPKPQARPRSDVKQQTISQRLAAGWSLDDALTRPPDPLRKRRRVGRFASLRAAAEAADVHEEKFRRSLTPRGAPKESS